MALVAAVVLTIRETTLAVVINNVARAMDHVVRTTKNYALRAKIKIVVKKVGCGKWNAHVTQNANTKTIVALIMSSIVTTPLRRLQHHLLPVHELTY